MNRRLTIAFMISLLVPLIYWLAGFDFNERGFASFFCFVFWLIALVAAFAASTALKEELGLK